MADEPLAHLTYTLTTSDALAYESLPREIVGWRRWSFLIWLAAAGMALALLPGEWVGPEGGPRFWVALVLLLGAFWALAVLVMTLNTHRRARRRVPAPTAVAVKQWGDGLEVAEAGRTFTVPYDTIADVAATTGHVFVSAPPLAIIIPVAAFPSAEDMGLFASEIDRLSSESAL